VDEPPAAQPDQVAEEAGHDEREQQVDGDHAEASQNVRYEEEKGMSAAAQPSEV